MHKVISSAFAVLLKYVVGLVLGIIAIGLTWDFARFVAS